MTPAASTPPAPIPEERDLVAPLPDEPAADAVLAGSPAEDLADGVDGAGRPVVADEAGFTVEDDVEEEEEGVAAAAGLLPVVGLAAALGERAGLSFPTTGGVPVGVAGTDSGAPPATTGLAEDEADAPPVPVDATGVAGSAFFASSFFAGADPPDAADAALRSSCFEGVGEADPEEADFAEFGVCLETSFAAGPDAAAAVVPEVASAPASVGFDEAWPDTPPSGVAVAWAPVVVALSPSVTVFFSALRSIVCPRVCFGFDRRGRLVIAFAPFLLTPARDFAGSARRVCRGVLVLHSRGSRKHRVVQTINLG